MPTFLGQNFLKDKNVVKKIIESANLTMDDIVLEIGPGKGILTEELAKVAGKVLAVEIDNTLSDSLRNKLRNIKNVEIIQGDILKVNLQDVVCHSERAKRVEESNKIRSLDPLRSSFSEASKLGMTQCDYKVIANLPYYITSPIIRLFLEAEFSPSEMILMVQKEVAERITAKVGKMSILAVSVQYYAKAEILFEVGKENFNPMPEVDSAIIRISRIANPEKERIKTNKFFQVVRAGFCAKRKTLANNLANSFHLDKKIVEEKLVSLKIKNTARAQELSVEDWKKLVELF